VHAGEATLALPAPVAQGIERAPPEREVAGSIPAGRTPSHASPAAVIGGLSILGGRGNYLGTVAGAVSLVALISLLQAENMPDYGRSIVYGVAILVVLVLFGREERV
jgi:predicted ABC-type sugar transport system permease subunit